MNRNVEAFLEQLESDAVVRDRFYSCKDWNEAYTYALTLRQGFSLMDLMRGFCQCNQISGGFRFAPCGKEVANQ
ncbi:MAG: hypothetical protein SPF89_02080 [Sphaerochaetaceae bacterium]|nr:hypothetical protein [Spirochaetales bacterium]MDY5498875.1 hypothetical protein [Sphaerochaetaceae bacterium]